MLSCWSFNRDSKNSYINHFISLYANSTVVIRVCTAKADWNYFHGRISPPRVYSLKVNMNVKFFLTESVICRPGIILVIRRFFNFDIIYINFNEITFTF